MVQNINNRELTETINYNTDSFTEENVGTWQRAFLLNALDFEYIKNGKSQLHNWANNIFIASIASGLMILAKLIANLSGETENITNLEWYYMGIAFVVSIILYILKEFFPSSHKKTIKKIQEHFDKSPEIQQIREK